MNQLGCMAYEPCDAIMESWCFAAFCFQNHSLISAFCMMPTLTKGDCTWFEQHAHTLALWMAACQQGKYRPHVVPTHDDNLAQSIQRLNSIDGVQVREGPRLFPEMRCSNLVLLQYLAQAAPSTIPWSCVVQLDYGWGSNPTIARYLPENASPT